VGGVGADGGSPTTTMVYHPPTNTWSTAAGLITRRQHLGVGAFDGLVYAVGGRTGGLDTNLDAAEAFDPSAGTWTVLPDLPTARGGLAAAATSNGFIVAAGGERPTGTFDEVEALHVDSGNWISLPPMPTARHGLGVAAVGTVVFVLAGGPEPGLSFSDANESFDLPGVAGR
jgi:hypothetical protein